MKKEDLFVIMPFAFPICMVWVCAWLHTNVQYQIWDGIWNNYDTVGFMFTPYGFALIVTIVFIELLLWIIFGRTL